jgi:hypothetical protein
LWTTVTTKNPFAGGAAGAATFDSVNAMLGGEPLTVGKFVSDVAVGAILGKISEMVTSAFPWPRGGENFKPFTSPRATGPAAQQLYMGAVIEHAEHSGAQSDTSGGNCGCK